MTPIPPKIRKLIDLDPYYKTCAFYGQFGHTCEGRITMEHAIIYAGRQLQELWAIIPVCAHGHGVDSHQDDASTSKEARVWIALNRASINELMAISKATDYFRERTRLNGIYGPYVAHVPLATGMPPQPVQEKTKMSWYPVSQSSKDKVLRITKFNKKVLGLDRSPWETITALIESEHDTIRDQVSNLEGDPLSKELGFDK